VIPQSTPIGSENLDRELALARVGGDLDLLKEIASLFVEDYPKVLIELHNAVACGDARAVERTAHGLKGSVSTFGARAAMEAARTLENLGRAQQLADLHPVLDTLEHALANLRPELESL
jgi:HPt (histidine-containing phosphotransfer) domain-containing protein